MDDDRTPRLNRFLDRAAPALRKVDAAIANNDDLRAARDLIAERVTDAAHQAANAIKGMGGPEVIDVELHTEAGGAVAKASAAQPASTRPASTKPAPADRARPVEARAPHWNRARIGRMVAAAGREAVRPQASPTAVKRLAIAAGSVLGLVLLWRWSHRR